MGNEIRPAYLLTPRIEQAALVHGDGCRLQIQVGLRIWLGIRRRGIFRHS